MGLIRFRVCFLKFVLFWLLAFYLLNCEERCALINCANNFKATLAWSPYATHNLTDSVAVTSHSLKILCCAGCDESINKWGHCRFQLHNWFGFSKRSSYSRFLDTGLPKCAKILEGQRSNLTTSFGNLYIHIVARNYAGFKNTSHKGFNIKRISNTFPFLEWIYSIIT